MFDTAIGNTFPQPVGGVWPSAGRWREIDAACERHSAAVEVLQQAFVLLPATLTGPPKRSSARTAGSC